MVITLEPSLALLGLAGLTRRLRASLDSPGSGS